MYAIGLGKGVPAALALAVVDSGFARVPDVLVCHFAYAEYGRFFRGCEIVEKCAKCISLECAKMRIP